MLVHRNFLHLGTDVVKLNLRQVVTHVVDVVEHGAGIVLLVLVDGIGVVLLIESSRRIALTEKKV